MKCFDPFGRYAHTVLMVVAMLSLAACGGGVPTTVVVRDVWLTPDNFSGEGITYPPYHGRTVQSLIDEWRKVGIQVFSMQCGNWQPHSPSGVDTIYIDDPVPVVAIEVASSDVEQAKTDGFAVLGGDTFKSSADQSSCSLATYLQ